MSEQNPYKNDTPEWQLWENMKSNDRQSLAFNADAQRYLEKSQACRERAELYKAALAKLEASHE